MKSWPAPDVPAVPGQGLPLRLFDTSAREVRPTAPGPTARMYVCGITPYDATHMGHAFTYVTFDLVNRAWRDAGHDVHYVQNVTDIDDPLLERAQATGDDWQAIAERETELFREDMTALNVIPPRHYLGAVETIPAVADRIAVLRDRGAVYDVEGDLYFRTASDLLFGDVSSLDRDTMIATFAERGGDPDRPGKEDPLDSLLWRAERDGEPAWNSVLGRGRPGWHIECAVIATDALGMGIDVQGGGSDLVFPHHEMSSSQAEVLTGEYPFARHYVHSAMVGWQGEKMSKSRGNLVFVSALRRDGVDPMAIRLALLAHHYRADWEWTDAGLADAVARLDRWRRAVSASAGAAAGATIQRMREVLSDDLNAPSAIAAVDEWVARQLGGAPGRPAGEGGTDTAAPAQIRAAVDALLGVRL